MPQNTAPFIDPNTITADQFIPQSYAQPNMIGYYGGPKTTGGKYNMFSPTTIAGPIGPGTGPNFSGNSMQTAASILAPGLGNLLNGLIGGEKESFQPYINEQGQLVWGSSVNPVPVPQVPGTSIKPSKEYKKTAQSVQAITDLLPYYNSAVNQQVLPSELAKLGAAQQTSGPYAALMTQLYNTYGPQLNAIGNEIAKRNALSQAQTEQDVINGPGQGLVKSAYDLSQTFDAPFYNSRSAAADKLAALLGSIDPSGALSNTERDEVQKGLMRENLTAGTAFTPSQTNTVSNAMRYGEKGRERQLQSQDALTKAIAASAAFLPASKSGVDVFQVATGRPSVPNSGNALFPGIQQTSGSQGAQLGGQMFGGMNQLQQTQMTIDSQKKDWLDQMNQFTSSLSNIGSIAGGLMGCWVAREVYGINNSKWVIFRLWMYNKAPKWLLKLYLNKGEKFAKFIHNKPWMKSTVKSIMDKILCNAYAR